ncbi:AMP-binding protein [Paenibacillus jamilae]
MIKSNAFVNLMHCYTHAFTFSESDCVLLIASISFDLAQKNLYAPLLTGGRLCLFPAGVNDYAGISKTIEREQVTVINCAPSLIYPLIDLHVPEEDQKDLGRHFSRLRSVNRLFLGGEPINLLKLRPWTTSPSFCAEIINTYGPTECTDVSSYYQLTHQDVSHGTNVPIGSSVYNTQLYVLDENLQVLPLGMVG